jgi:AraC-like DNA-binding protein
MADSPTATSVALRLFGGAAQGHAHEHFHVLWGYEGTLELEIAGRKSRLDPGRVAVIAPGEWHAFAAPRGARCFVMSSTDAGHWAVLSPLAGQVRSHGASLTHLMQYLASLSVLPGLAVELLIASLDESAELRERVARRAIDWIALDAWIDAHLAEAIDVAAMAARVHLSVTQFAQRCRVERGCAPMALVRQHRLAAARRLLDEGVPVYRAALHCGYRSPSALTASLRRAAARVVHVAALRDDRRATLDWL